MTVSSDKNRIVLGITGSIAAYKSAELARLFVTRGYTVRVVMSEAAQEFISPLTMQAVTGQPVMTSFWEEDGEIGHIALADWADTVVVAPASADFLAKATAGFADNPLLAILLATKAPVLVAPAMNVNMFEHPKTQENVAVLRERGVEVVDPEEGALACGWKGTGRMASPWEIFYSTLRSISSGDYVGKKVLVVTGPTREPIDPVRFISNRSSGKMGVALAREAFRRGADVTVIHGPIKAKLPTMIPTVPVTTALEMYDEVMQRAFPENPEDGPDYLIMTAAVADFRPKEQASHKLKKGDSPKTIPLAMNPDILGDMGQKRGDSSRPALVGFAVETGEIEDLLEEASKKINSKNADLIVGNFAEDAFDLDTNRVWIVDKFGKREEVATTFKSRVAMKILNRVIKL